MLVENSLFSVLLIQKDTQLMRIKWPVLCTSPNEMLMFLYIVSDMLSIGLKLKPEGRN